MTVGDNFDTSSLGMKNRRTGRIAGSFESGQTNQDNNFGHPCNIGCGCKKVCDGILGPCLLPPELTITLIKTPDGRVTARRIGASAESTGSGDPNVKGEGNVFHLIYTNGVWRGRKCCTSIYGDTCDPCSVTTLSDNRKAELECSYYGKEGTSRGRKGGTTRPYDFRANARSGQETAGVPVFPGLGGECLPDGEKARIADDYCWNVVDQKLATKNTVQCFDGDTEVRTDVDHPDKAQECKDAGYKVVHATRQLTQKECLEEAKCVTGEDNTITSKWNCLSLYDPKSTYNTTGKESSVEKTWTLEWKSGTEVVFNSKKEIIAGGYNPMSCCGGYVIDQWHTSHTPNIRSGSDGVKHGWQGTCVTPYEEVVLKPGVPDNMTPGMPLFNCNTGTQNSHERFEMHGDLEGSGFTLVYRGCDFYNNYNPDDDPYNNPDSTDADISSGGKEKVLIIPMDQIMNCSDFTLTELDGGHSSKRGGWQPEYGDLAGNAAGDVYPGDPHSTHGGDPALNYCMRESQGPWHDSTKDEWPHGGGFRGAGDDGSSKFKRSNVPKGFGPTGKGEYVETEQGSCSVAYYWENSLGLDPHNARSFHNPGDWALRKLNLQPQPFKATEWRQNKKKTLQQAEADRNAFEQCISAQWPTWCQKTGLPFWFENDFLWDKFTYKYGRYGSKTAISHEACSPISKSIYDMLQVSYDDKNYGSEDDPVYKGKCVYSFQNTKKRIVQKDTVCVCEVLDDKGALVAQGAIYTRGCPSSAIDHAGSGKTATCREIDGKDVGFMECMVDSYDYCDDDNYISFEGCMNAGGQHLSTMGSWEYPEIEGTGKFGHTQCGGCGSGPRIAFFVDDPPEGLSPQERLDWERKYRDGQNMKDPSSDPDNYHFINLPSQITSKMSELYANRKDIDGYDEDETNSLEYWGKTGLWPEHTSGASYIAHTFLGLNTTRKIINASNTSPIVVQSTNHGLRLGDHLGINGVLGNFRANTWTIGEWMEQAWHNKRSSPCSPPTDCDAPIWPDAVCPCNDGTCSDPSSMGAFGKEQCESLRSSWDISCKIDGKEDMRFMNQKECENSGECYEVNLGNEHFDPKRKISDDIEKLKAGPNEADCLKYGDSSTEINTVWEPYGDKAKWLAACSNPNYKTEEECKSARPKWTYNNIYGKDNEHCSGVIIKGKNPPPADYFVVKPVDDDHFQLWNCKNEPIDGTPDEGIVCEDDEALDLTEKACGNTLAPFNQGVIGNCPCQTIYLSKQTVWDSEIDLPTLNKTTRIPFQSEDTCLQYGYCWIVDPGYTEHSIMTKGDCDLLAQHYETIEWNYKDKKFVHTLLEKHLSDNPNNRHPCTDGTDLTGCWDSLEWTRKKSIEDAALGATPSGAVSNWEVCPYSGSWTIWDMNRVNPLISDPNDPFISWRPFWTESYYKTEEGAEDHYVSIHQEEVCPVCCDHFMPEKLLVTVDGLAVGGSTGSGDPNKKESKSIGGVQGTEHFDYMTGGTFNVKTPDQPAAYCAETKDDGKQTKTDKSQADCTTGEDTPDGVTYDWVVPIKVVEAHCGINPCTGKLYDFVETDIIDPRTKAKGRVGGEYCCDCDGGLENGVFHVFSCVRCSDALRFDGPVVDHEFGDSQLGIAPDPCCSCECNPGEGNKPTASLMDYKYPTHTQVCDEIPDVAGQTLTVGELTCKIVTVEEYCEATVTTCLDLTDEEKCNAADVGDGGCYWASTEGPQGEELFFCKDRADSVGFSSEKVCTERYEEKGACNASPICAWVDDRTACSCGTDGVGRVGCTGFPNNRPLKCEPSPMGVDLGACEYDFAGKKIIAGGDIITKGGMYINAEAVGGQGCGEPNTYAMPTAECWTHKYEIGDGCSGLGVKTVEMEYNGSHWTTPWFPMMADSPKTRVLNDGQSYPEFVGGMSCQNFAIHESCESGWGGRNSDRNYKHVLTAAMGDPNSDMNCGGCSTHEWNGVEEPPIPSPKMDAYLMRIRMGCGGAYQMYHGMSTLMNWDYYQNNQLSLFAEITKCDYHHCNKFNVMDGYRPPCPSSGDNCVNTSNWSAQGWCEIGGVEGYCTCPVQDRGGAPDFIDKLDVTDAKACIAQFHEKAYRWFDEGVCTTDDKNPSLDGDGKEITDPFECEALGGTMGLWRPSEEPMCGGLEDCHCIWSHIDSKDGCEDKGGKWHRSEEPVPYYDDCVNWNGWVAVPGVDCDAIPPCTECCSFYPFKHGQPTVFTTAQPLDEHGAPKQYISCASASMISSMDSSATPYGIEGMQFPRWKHKTHADRATKLETTGWKPKTPENFTVYYVEGSSYGQKLVVKKGSRQACNWYAGDPVSIGMADKVDAEIGQGLFQTRDRLSAQPDWPNHTTKLASDINTGKVRWGVNKDGEITDPTEYMEIGVNNAAALISRAHIEQSRYWRAQERYLSGEPWPYGDKVWPVGHQTNTTVPSHTVNVGQLESVGGGPYTVANAARSGRIGHLPTLANINDPKKAVFVGDWPLHEVSYGTNDEGEDDTTNPIPVNNNDYNNSIAIADIENVYDFDNAYCTDPAGTDQDTCEAIGYCWGIEEEDHQVRRVIEDIDNEKDCHNATEKDSDGKTVSAGYQWERSAWWMPIFKYTLFTMGARHSNGSIVKSEHDLRAGEKIIINGSQCHKAYCAAPVGDERWKLPDHVSSGDDEMMEGMMEEVKNHPTLDKTLCEKVYKGVWTAPKTAEGLQQGCSPLCRLDAWFNPNACGELCADSIITPAFCSWLENGDKTTLKVKKNTSYCMLLGKKVDLNEADCKAVKAYECKATSGPNAGKYLDTGNCQDPLGTNKDDGNDDCPCCPDPNASLEGYDGMKKYPNCKEKWTISTGVWTNAHSYDPDFSAPKDCQDTKKCACIYTGKSGQAGEEFGVSVDGVTTKSACEALSPNTKWVCGGTDTKWNEEEQVLPECVIDGSHVVGLIDGGGNIIRDPHKSGRKDVFTILNENPITPNSLRPESPTNYNDIINENAVTNLGHEIMGGGPKNLWKGAVYTAGEINDEGAAEPYAGGSWSRHGGTFNIRVGAKPQLDDCAQGNSDSPVYLTYFLNMDNSMCNHYLAPTDDKCGEQCWRGYGPYTEPNMTFEDRGRALIRVDITEA